MALVVGTLIGFYWSSICFIPHLFSVARFSCLFSPVVDKYFPFSFCCRRHSRMDSVRARFSVSVSLCAKGRLQLNRKVFAADAGCGCGDPMVHRREFHGMLNNSIGLTVCRLFCFFLFFRNEQFIYNWWAARRWKARALRVVFNRLVANMLLSKNNKKKCLCKLISIEVIIRY